MNCFHCGAKLEKSDIFCMRCETPVLTEDDASLVNYKNNLPEGDEFNSGDTARYVDSGSFSLKNPDSYNKIDANAAKRSNFDSSFNNAQYIDFSQDDDLNIEWQSDDRQSGSKNRHAAVVIITIVICLALLGIVAYFLIQPPRSQPRSGSDPAVSTDDGGAVQAGSGAGSVHSSTVTAINVSVDGRVQTEFHTRVNDTVSLRAHIVPAGADAGISWESTDPDILEVVLLDSNGLEAQITGKTAGVADIVLSAGDFSVAYIVFVDNLPPHVQLENAVANTNSSVWITISWTSGHNSGQEFLIERNQSSQGWSLESESGKDEVVPVFKTETNAFVIGFDDATDKYYLFADNTGFFGSPEIDNNDEFIWWFMTTQIEHEG